MRWITFLGLLFIAGSLQAAQVTSVASASGTKDVGETVSIAVTFDAPVTAMLANTPKLQLNVGRTPGNEAYAYVTVNQISSTTINFVYVVEAGDNSTDLNYTNVSALTGISGMSVTLPLTTDAASLGMSSSVVIDTAPVIRSVTSSLASGSYRAGQIVPITVQFSELVNLAGTTPSINFDLQLVSGTTQAKYVSGSGTAQLQFIYTIQATQNAPQLDYVTSSNLSLSGTGVTFTDAGTKNAALSLPAAGSSSLRGLTIDTTQPSWTLNPSVAATATAPVSVNITASEAVIGFTAADLTATNATATFGGSSPNFTSSLTPKSRLIASSTVNDGSLLRLQTRTGSVGLTVGMPLQIGIKTVFVAAIATVTSTATDVYIQSPLSTGVSANTDVWLPTGEDMKLDIAASAAQDLAGNPSAIATQLIVIFDPTRPYATITAPTSYNSTLNFTVEFSEAVSTLLPSALTLSGGGTLGTLVKDPNNKKWTVPVTGVTETQNVSLTVKANSVLDQVSNGNLMSDTVTFDAVAVSNIVATPNVAKRFGVGQTVDLVVNLNRTVAFIPGSEVALLALETGGDTKNAQLISPLTAGQTNALTFRYTVVSGDTSNDLDVKGTSPLNLNGGKLDGISTLAVPAPATAGSLSATSAVTIDSTKPTVTTFAASVTGALKALLSVTFDEPIAPNGSGSATLEPGDFSVPAGVIVGTTVVAPDGRNATVEFTLPATSVPTSFVVSLNSAAVADRAGNTSTDTPSATIVYDPVAPVLTLSATPGDKATTPLSVLMAASKYVTGMATDDCNVTNGVASSISAAVGTSFAVGLTPTATLQLGQAAAIGVTTIRLQATIGDVSLAARSVLRLTNAGVTTVVRLSTTNDIIITSIGATVGIDTAMPIALSAGTAAWSTTGVVVTMSVRANACSDGIGQNNPSPANPIAVRYDPTPPMFRVAATAYTYDGDIIYTVTSSEPVTGFSASGIAVTNCVVSGIDPIGASDHWTVYVTPTASTSLTLGIKAAAATDNAGNASLAEAPAPFTIIPRIVNMSCNNADGTYNPGMRLVIKVVFTENVTVTGFPHLALNLTTTGRDAIYKSGSGTKELLFDYTIVEGDATNDLDYLNFSPFTLPDGAAVFDADNYRASLTLGDPGNPTSLSANSAIVVNDGEPAAPGKPGISDQPAGSGGCGAGSGIALLLAGGWLGLGVSLRRRRRAA